MSFYAFYAGSSGGGGGGGTVTAVTATSPLFSSGGATPNITIQVATAVEDGYLSAVDWNTFNNKQNALTIGDLTDVGTDGITVTGGVGAVIGTGTSIAQQVADTTHNGYLSSVDWNTFNSKQSALTIGDLTDVGTDGITVTNGVGSVIGTGTSLSQQVADTTHNGYLSSVDWNTFNAKQPAGSYITALTGDVTASGPGSVAATLASFVNRVYVDLLNGSDAGTGTPIQPWKTIQHAYNSITPTINEPYVIYVSGGNNDTDVGPITGKPNVSIVADYEIQITPALTISGGATNDTASFVNITFAGGFTWTRNDATEISISFINCEFFGAVSFGQMGAGSADITALNSVFSAVSFTLPGAFAIFNGCSFLSSTTFNDSGSSPYYEFIGGYSDGAMSISGGVNPVYFSGFIHDTTFGASLTFVTTGSGTPAVQCDSAGLPPAYTGSPTITYLSWAQYEAYSPATPGDWSPAPSLVNTALDQLAARPAGGGSVTTVSVATANGFAGTVASPTTTPAITVETTITGLLKGNGTAISAAVAGTDYQAAPVTSTKTTTYTAVVNDVVLADASGGAFVVNMPTAASSTNQLITIKKIDSSVNAVTITPSGSDVIDGFATYPLTDQNSSATLISDGSNWYDI